MLPMSKTQDAAPKKVGRGRPKMAPDTASLTVVIPRSEAQLAERLAVDLDRVVLGLRHNRLDVIRAAITRGLASLKAELEQAQARAPSDS